MSKKKIKRLTLSGFRGIRYSTALDFTAACNSTLIYGANAKGKSSIGDAIEWFFTGRIEELSKEGCTRADYRHRLLKNDENTEVSIKFSDQSLDSNLILPNSLAQKYSNESDDFSRFLLSSSEELLILRHRDLKHFVEATKSYKRERISKLIGMEDWERIRNEMLATRNRLAQGHEAELQELVRKQEEVTRLVEIKEFSEHAAWDFATNQAKSLGITKKIDGLESLAAVGEEAKAAAGGTEREVELARLKVAEAELADLKSTPVDLKPLNTFADRFNRLCAEPEKVLSARIGELHAIGKEILESGQWVREACPLCNLEIPSTEIIGHISEHAEMRLELDEELAELQTEREGARKAVSDASARLERISKLKLDKIEEFEKATTTTSEFALRLGDAKGYAEKAVEAHATIDISHLELVRLNEDLHRALEKTSVSISENIQALTPTEAETVKFDAIQKLGALQVYMAALQEINARAGHLGVHYESLAAFTATFEDLRRSTMGEVLGEISGDVARYFLQLHPDEGFDDIQLKFLPEVDGVEFHVIYKDEDISPPRKFLSESYLSGLGVCLFLATVRAFNTGCGFILLDDIVNSFDSDHRAELARLLVNEFKDYQLIILTHDGIWFDLFRRLAQAGWQHRRITRWSYEEGMDIEQAPADALEETREAIDSGLIDYAAPKVRTYMENRLKRLGFELGVRVRFKPGSQNDERTAGELLSELRSYLSERDFFDQVDSTSFNELGASTFIANYGSHDRSVSPEAAGLVMGDVSFALDRMLDLEIVFICQECNRPVWSIRDRNFNMNCSCRELHL